ncbi:uncharacterized protein LOC125047147 [Penaeus chinensis]|uniref:uncharacterized protein LOC125047147 n=1 Tax=Penaeus chinensis TaxID=139456 RepID=UPI001FB757C4|nr:uncharacterized protein LOC125047147 [Penaeus chinensis]
MFITPFRRTIMGPGTNLCGIHPHSSNRSNMKWSAGRILKVALPVVVLAVFTFVSQPRNLSLLRDNHNVTLVLSARQIKALTETRKPEQTQEKGEIEESKREKPLAPENIVVINNKVYDRNEVNLTAIQTEPQKKVHVSKKENRTRSWPPTLELSDAAFLQHLDYSKYRPKERSILKARVGVFVERARRAGRACRGAPPDSRMPERSRFVWDRKHSPSIVFCPNYKVASTTWMSNFLKLAHYNEDNPAIPDNLPKARREKMQLMAKYGAKHDVVFKLYPTPSSDAEKLKVMSESVRVTVVRHPFARLLSGYRDKMTKMRPSPVKFGFRKIQQEIIAKYRSHVTNNTSPFPTFEEFVRYVIDSTGNLTTARDWEKNINCWVPYWAQCSVCATDYTLIMKLETMAEDEQFLVVLSNLKELKGKKGKNWKHLNGQSSHDAAPQYYRELTKAQMRSLYERYKMDFDLFGYDIDNFLAIAKDAEAGGVKGVTLGKEGEGGDDEEEDEDEAISSQIDNNGNQEGVKPRKLSNPLPQYCDEKTKKPLKATETRTEFVAYDVSEAVTSSTIEPIRY